MHPVPDLTELGLKASLELGRLLICVWEGLEGGAFPLNSLQSAASVADLSEARDFEPQLQREPACVLVLTLKASRLDSSLFSFTS